MTEIEEQVAQAFGAERFPGTFDDVQARLAARRRVRRGLTAGAAFVAAAAAVVALAVVRPQHAKPPIVATTPSPTPTAISAAEFEAGCARKWQEYVAQHVLSADMGGQPPLRFDKQSGYHRLRIYATDKIEFECYVDPTGKVESGSAVSAPVGQSLLTVTGRDIQAFGTFSGTGAAMNGYYVGQVFPGATAITAHVPGGPDIPAWVDGDLFLVWQPAGPFDNVLITARSGQATVVEGLTSLTRRADDRESTMDHFCRTTIDDLVERAGPVLSGVVSAPSILAVKGGSGDHRIWIYRRGSLLIPCYLRDKLQGRLGTAILPDAADQWLAGGHVEMMTGGETDQWMHAFGLVPHGMTDLMLHMSDGRTVPAVIQGGYFLAHWRTVGRPVQPEYVTATVNGVHYRMAPDGTVSIA